MMCGSFYALYLDIDVVKNIMLDRMEITGQYTKTERGIMEIIYSMY